MSWVERCILISRGNTGYFDSTNHLLRSESPIISMVYTGYNLLDKTFQEKKHLLSNIQQKYFKNFQSKYENGDKKR